jgi:hypothetical protein
MVSLFNQNKTGGDLRPNLYPSRSHTCPGTARDLPGKSGRCVTGGIISAGRYAEIPCRAWLCWVSLSNRGFDCPLGSREESDVSKIPQDFRLDIHIFKIRPLFNQLDIPAKRFNFFCLV